MDSAPLFYFSDGAQYFITGIFRKMAPIIIAGFPRFTRSPLFWEEKGQKIYGSASVLFRAKMSSAAAVSFCRTAAMRCSSLRSPLPSA